MIAKIVSIVFFASTAWAGVVPGMLLEPCTQLDKLIPDPQNCGRFYECTQGGWVGLACYPGLYFNPATDQCDYSWNVDCKDNVPAKVNLEPCPISELDELKPDPKNCSRFYECTRGGWVGEACNPGLEFNSVTSQCDYPENVVCPKATVAKVAGVPLEPCSEVGKLLPDPQNCSRFYECTESGWVGFACYRGLDFNPKTSHCDFPSNVDCTNESPYEVSINSKTEQLYDDICQRGQLKPDPKNCSRFYECVGPEWVRQNCSVGLWFNPVTNQCDYPENVKCTTELKSSELPACGPQNFDELFPDPANCSRFLECSDLGLVSMPCPAGLHFNRNTLLCDYIWNVEC